MNVGRRTHGHGHINLIIEQRIVGNLHILFRIDNLFQVDAANFRQRLRCSPRSQRIVLGRNGQLPQRRLLRCASQLIDIVLIIHVIARPVSRPKARCLVIRGRGEQMPQRMPRKIPNNLFVRFVYFRLTT